MTISRNVLRHDLETAQATTYRFYALHGEHELSKGTGCYASGRYDGLKQALEILEAQPSLAPHQKNSSVLATSRTAVARSPAGDQAVEEFA